MRNITNEDIGRLMKENAALLNHLRSKYAVGIDADDEYTIRLEAIWQSAQKHDPAKGPWNRLLTWTYMFRCIDHRRQVLGHNRSKHYQRFVPLADHHNLLPSHDPDPTEQIGHRDKVEVVWRQEIRHVLTKREWKIVVRYEAFDLTHSEIRAEGIKASATTLHNARHKLTKWREQDQQVNE